jgi:hypothetical protein
MTSSQGSFEEFRTKLQPHLLDVVSAVAKAGKSSCRENRDGPSWICGPIGVVENWFREGQVSEEYKTTMSKFRDVACGKSETVEAMKKFLKFGTEGFLDDSSPLCRGATVAGQLLTDLDVMLRQRAPQK